MFLSIDLSYRLKAFFIKCYNYAANWTIWCQLLLWYMLLTSLTGLILWVFIPHFLTLKCIFVSRHNFYFFIISLHHHCHLHWPNIYLIFESNCQVQTTKQLSFLTFFYYIVHHQILKNNILMHFQIICIHLKHSLLWKQSSSMSLQKVAAHNGGYNYQTINKWVWEIMDYKIHL